MSQCCDLYRSLSVRKQLCSGVSTQYTPCNTAAVRDMAVTSDSVRTASRHSALRTIDRTQAPAGSWCSAASILLCVCLSVCTKGMRALFTGRLDRTWNRAGSVAEWLECLTSFEVKLLIPMPAPLPIWISTAVYNLQH